MTIYISGREWTLLPVKAILKVPRGELNKMSNFIFCVVILDISLLAENNTVLQEVEKCALNTQQLGEQLHQHLKVSLYTWGIIPSEVYFSHIFTILCPLVLSWFSFFFISVTSYKLHSLATVLCRVLFYAK